MPRLVPARPRTSWLFIGGALALAAVIVLCAIAAMGYAAASRWVDHTLSVQSELDGWVSSIARARHAAVAYATTGSEEALREYQGAYREAQREEVQLEALVLDNAAQNERVLRTRRIGEALFERLQARVAQAQAGQRTSAVEELASRADSDLVTAFRESARGVRVEEARLLKERRAHADSLAWIMLSVAGLLALVSLTLLIFAWRREAAHEQRVSTMAREARQRLWVLSELAAALSSTRTPEEVGEVVVHHGMQAAGGDTCSLYLLNTAQTALELIATRGVSAELVDKLRRVSATEGFSGIFEAMAAGKSIWVQNEREYARIYPDLANLKVAGQRPKAFWSVPLVVEGRTLGLFGVGYYQPRNFTADERAFVETLGHQCAQALLRASRLQAEEAARRWFVTTLRSIGDAVIATDADGRVTFVNPVAQRLTGFEEREAVGKPLTEVFQIVSELTRAPVEDPVTKVLREDRIIGLANHTLLRQKSGALIPIDDSGAPIRDEGGHVVGVVLVFRDVSEKKRTELQNEYLAKAGEALASSLDYRQTLATIAEFAVPQLADWCAVDLVEPSSGLPKQVAVAHTDPSKVALARELGERYPPDPDSRSGVPQVVRSGNSELYIDIPPELLEAAARDEEHRRVIRELTLRSGMVVPLRTHGRTFGAMTFVYAESGRHYTREDLSFAEELARRAAMAIENAMALRDADEARSVERWMRAEAERANRAKDEFLATVSHELRTPLNAILGWAVTLRGRNPPEDVDRGLAVIERNARSQAKLIEDVLDVSRIISGKLSLTLAPTDVGTALRKAVENVAPAAQAKNISLAVEVSDDGLTVLADGERLQQVAWNLLSNAVKFTPKHGHVNVNLKSDGADIVIQVRDDGEGIRADVLPLVFEPFQQADASTTRRHGGLGLGLAIVKQLVVAHGGSVSAESEGTGRGATFTLRLPARSPGTTASDAESPGPPAKAPRDLLFGLKVLVVDDEPDALALARAVLSEAGAEVHTAGSASDALERFRELRPDVLVSDIGMPQEDGYSLIRKVRAQPADGGGRTPAVALTAYARPEDAQRAFVAGFQRHIVKPIEPTALTSVVANLAGRSLESAPSHDRS